MILPLGFTSVGISEVHTPTSEPRYAWSFVGEASKSSRVDMVHAMSHVEPHICYSSIPVPVFSFFDRGLHGGKRFPEEAFVGILAIQRSRRRQWETRVSNRVASTTLLKTAPSRSWKSAGRWTISRHAGRSSSANGQVVA